MKFFNSGVQRASWLLFVFLCLVLVACGGSGSAKLVSPKVVINWPDTTTRGVAAPTYATSALITISPSNGGSPVTWIADRPTGSGAQSVTYPGPVTTSSIAGSLVVTFRSGTGATGAVVANASANIIVSPDGTILNAQGGVLGNVSYSTALTGISVDAPNVGIEATVDVIATGQSNTGIVALPQELVQFTLTSGNSFATLQGNKLTGVAEGMTTVQAAFEGMAGSDVSYVTLPTLPYTRIDFPATKIAADLTHNKIWGTFSSSSTYPNSIVDIDVATGNIGTPIPVGTNPEAIDISPDGTVAYVGINGSKTIVTVDLVSRTVGTTIQYIQLDANTVPDTIKINPTNYNEAVIGVRSLQNNAKRGPYIVRNDGTAIAATQNTDAFQTVLWASSNEVIRGQSGASGSLTRYQVNESSVDRLHNVVPNEWIYGDLDMISGSRMIDDHGRIISATDFTTVGSLTSPDAFLGVAADVDHNIAYAAVGGTTNPLRFRSFDLTTYASTGTYVVPMNHEAFLELLRFGPSGIVVRSTQSVWIMSNVPGL